MKRAVIYFKDGTTDFVDPVEEDSIEYTETMVTICNGVYDYEYLLSKIDRVEFVELSEEQK